MRILALEAGQLHSGWLPVWKWQSVRRGRGLDKRIGVISFRKEGSSTCLIEIRHCCNQAFVNACII